MVNSNHILKLMSEFGVILPISSECEMLLEIKALREKVRELEESFLWISLERDYGINKQEVFENG